MATAASQPEDARRPRATVVGDSLPGHESRRCARRSARSMLLRMVEEIRGHRVEVSFVGAPPARQVERASGVSDVTVAGSILCCQVCGSFQPFLEALRGHEVVSLTSIPSGPSHPTGSARATVVSDGRGISR